MGLIPLLRDVAFTVEERARIGLIGPNGSGKSTLLGILAGQIEPDSGEVATRKRTRLSYVAQQSEFAPGSLPCGVLEASLKRIAAPAAEWEGRIGETLGRTGFEDFTVDASSLSGGWRKRLAIAEALVQQPDVLLLDEPTNHLDLGGIDWLEGLLNTASFACIVVSHDRYFLENVCTETVELNRAYPDGLLRVRRQLQRVSGKERSLPRSPGQAAGCACQPGAHRNRVVTPRTESAHHQVQGQNRSGP